MGNDNDTIIIYNNEKVKLRGKKSYTLRIAKPRPVEILVATGNQQEDSNLRIKIDSDDIIQRYPCRELSEDVIQTTELPRNRKFTLQIPQTARQPVFNLFPDAGNMNNSIQLTLKSFISLSNLDPVKMFVYYPKVGKNIPSIELDGDTSYLNNINFSQVSDDDETLLFSQEMQNPIGLSDGPVEIDSLTYEQCKNIANQVLGANYEEQVDEGKVKTEKYWTGKKGVTTGATTGKAIWNHRLVLKDFGFKGKFYIKTVKGKEYIVFRGYSGLRKWYTGTRYRVTNPKVINLSAAGKLKSGMKGNAVTILIVGAIDIADWILSEDEDKKFEDLCVTLGMDALKVVVGSVVTAGLAALALGFVALFGITAPVAVVIVGTIAIGITVGFIIDLIDTKIGATEYMQGKGRETGSFLEDAWQENVVEPLGRMYYQLEKTIENMYLRNMRIGY